MRQFLLALLSLLLAVAVAADGRISPTEASLNEASTVTLQPWPECGSEEMLKHEEFTLWDYSVVVGMLVVSLGIGVFYGFCVKGKNESSEDFLLGSGMELFPVTLSLCTSFITAIELLGNPAEMFFNGTQFSLIVLSMVLVIPMAVKVFYPIYFKMQLTSCYEYLGIRFGKRLRIFGAILYIIQVSDGKFS